MRSAMRLISVSAWIEARKRFNLSIEALIDPPNFYIWLFFYRSEVADLSSIRVVRFLRSRSIVSIIKLLLYRPESKKLREKEWRKEKNMGRAREWQLGCSTKSKKNQEGDRSWPEEKGQEEGKEDKRTGRSGRIRALYVWFWFDWLNFVEYVECRKKSSHQTRWHERGDAARRDRLRQRCSGEVQHRERHRCLHQERVWQEVQPHLALRRRAQLRLLCHPWNQTLHLLLYGTSCSPTLQVRLTRLDLNPLWHIPPFPISHKSQSNLHPVLFSPYPLRFPPLRSLFWRNDGSRRSRNSKLELTGVGYWQGYFYSFKSGQWRKESDNG